MQLTTGMNDSILIITVSIPGTRGLAPSKLSSNVLDNELKFCQKEDAREDMIISCVKASSYVPRNERKNGLAKKLELMFTLIQMIDRSTLIEWRCWCMYVLTHCKGVGSVQGKHAGRQAAGEEW